MKYPTLTKVLASEINLDQLDPFTRQYLVTALWSSTDNATPQGGAPLDENYSIEDIAPESIQQAIEDCKKFQADNATDLEGSDLETAGHDFWLTRNGHGSGYWDGDYPGEIGERLTEACKAYRELTPSIGDDGKIYFE
jgi:hypothetical protein